MTTAYKTLGALAFVTLIGTVAYATDRTATAAPADKAEIVSTTVEKTTATSYTKTTRKVGLVGGRPYKGHSEELEGGVRKDTSVNGMQTTSEIIVPDTVAKQAEMVKDENYFTNKYKAAKVYEADHSNVHVRNNGKLNH